MKCRVRLFLTEMHDQIRFKLWKNMIKNFSNSLRLHNGKYLKIYERSFEEYSYGQIGANRKSGILFFYVEGVIFSTSVC